MAALVLTCNACGNGTGATPGNQQSAGWELTVYYTPVEQYHGCLLYTSDAADE